MKSLLYSKDTGVLVSGDGARFDPWTWAWTDAAEAPPSDAAPVTPPAALTLLAEGGTLRPLPVGVIGPRDASDTEMEIASAVGAAVASHGLTLLCGGKSGVMTAAAKGARAAGGITIGLIPDSEWRAANSEILIPIATGLREARNVVIARSALALIAIGGSTGTMTEIAFGLHFGRLVVALPGTASLPGVKDAAEPNEALSLVAAHLLSGQAHLPKT